MALLIPKAVRKIRDEGRAEERQAQIARREEALRRFGVEENGVRCLTFTKEVSDFLAGKGENCD